MLESASTPVPAAHGSVSGAPTGTVARQVPSRGGPRLDQAPPIVFAPLGLRAVPRFTQCPPPLLDLAEPDAGNLAYEMALPSAAVSPAIARETAEVILDAHLLDEKVIGSALLLVHELVSYACRFTGAGEQVHLALRSVEGGLQVTVYDTHAAHSHPRLAAFCDERRRAALERIPELVEAHLGAWGFGATYPPGAGTCTWAGLACTPPGRAA
ncbi:ATP-binding protein [Streptomyces sp. DT171]|uniref:ATP-binding protein n=1 Tax=Streptomyces sp. DT171 TaxID=3416524 RepID=UPI003CF9C951